MNMLFVARDIDGESEKVVIAGNYNGLLIPIMVFDDFDKFKEFAGLLQEYINMVRPPVPSAFIKAFENGYSNSTKDK